MLKNGIQLKQLTALIRSAKSRKNLSHTSFIVPIVFNKTSCFKELPDKYFCCDGAFVIIDIPPVEVGLSVLLVAHFHLQLLYCHKFELRLASL